MESIFYSTLVDQLSDKLSEFNKAQLEILLQKHASAVCSAVCFEVCLYYACKESKDASLQSQVDHVLFSFQEDMKIFLMRFCNYRLEGAQEILDSLKNILMNVFIKRVVETTGINVYDSRYYHFRGFRQALERSSSSERILHLRVERIGVSPL
jgi:hypothetical protein